MKRTILIAPALAVCAAIAACTVASVAPDEHVDDRGDAVTAVGSVPAGLPAHVSVGLFEDKGATWMQGSGVPWDMRYAYFTKGWANNWGYGNYDGTWGLQYMQECSAAGFIPAVEYYVVNGEPGGGEAQFLAKVQNTSTMTSYFGDFKLLMQRAKDFGKPVVILLEADGFGFLEQQTSDNPGAYAAVAATGMPELAGMPNTVAGWGLAFLQLKKAVGATNAVLGIHVSAWASGKDIAYSSASAPLQPEVDKVYTFLSPLGLAANTTGLTYDLLVGDPLDRDSDYYQITQNQNRWWDPSDTASLTSQSFNHYAEWLGLWNVEAGKRWVLWQIPIGNSNNLDVANTGNPREGYKDNRAEYFFGGSTAHVAKFAAQGVVALLFGRGQGDQSNYTNDVYTDNQLFLKTHVASFYKAGGVSLGAGAADAGAADASSEGGAGDGGAGDAGADAGSTDTSRYGFESGVQGWATTGGMITGVSSSTSAAFAGTHSLAVTFNGAAGTQHVYVGSPVPGAGQTVTYHILVPAGSAISSVQPFVQQGSAGSWTWTGNWQSISSFTPGAWKTLNVTVPSNAATPLYQIGVEFTTNATWSGTAYIDAVTW